MDYVGTPEKAIDGDKAHGWCGTTIPGWLQVKFDKVYSIRKVGIVLGSHKQTYAISLSQDGEHWTTVVSARESPNSEGEHSRLESFDVPPTDAQYIRADITKTSAPGGHIFQAVVNELEAYGVPVEHPKQAAVTPPAALAAPPLAVAPFDAEQAKEHQQAWAKHLGVPVETTNSIGMKLVLIPPGEFMMGSPEDEKDRGAAEGPQHRVRITKPFYLGVYTVTQEEYRTGDGEESKLFLTWWRRGKPRCWERHEPFPGGKRVAGRRGGVLPMVVGIAGGKGGGVCIPVADRGPMGVCVPGGHNHAVQFWQRLQWPPGELRRQLPLRNREKRPVSGPNDDGRLISAERLWAL